MKYRTQLLAAALALLVSCNAADEAYRVVGELASERIELTAESNEPIIEIAVTEGTDVTAGQLLVRQDDARTAARLAETEAALAQQQARLDELVRGPRSEQIEAARANVQGATQELTFRQSELDRVTRIHEQGLASPDLLDRTTAALDAAEANLKLQRAQLQERLAGTTVEELAQAEQSVKQAAARRDSAAVDLERHNLRAPVDGVTDSRLYETGERPVPGQPVMILLTGSQPYARVYIPEILRVRIGPGTGARVYVDGIETPIEGRVRWVASEAAFTPYFALTERDRGRLSYVAKIDVVEERERLPDGVPVEAEFVLDDPIQ